MRSFFSPRGRRAHSKRSDTPLPRAWVEALEPRLLLAAIPVTSNANSGPGTLREAITTAIASPGNEIVFNLPAGQETIALSTALPDISGNAITISGDTQVTATGSPVVIDGAGVAGATPGLRIFATGTAVDGLTITHFGSHGIIILGSADNILITGNTIVSNTGPGVGIADGSNNVQVGGSLAGDGNVISGNNASGIEVIGDNAVIMGNMIGVDATGTIAQGNNGQGIFLSSLSTGTVIGGVGDFEHNVIGANIRGIQSDRGRLFSVLGNYIGTDPTGTIDLGNTLAGVEIFGVTAAAGTLVNSFVGGINDDEGNVIAYNGTDGVALVNNAFNVSIRGNSIHDNGSTANDLGIELGGNGVTANDPGDPDAGSNGLQNYPVITGATSDGTDIEITGSLDSTVGLTFQLDFYASPAADTSGFGEGAIYLGTDTVTLTSGPAGFTATVPANAPAGYVITATATSPSGATSEFSGDAISPTVIILSNLAPTADAGGPYIVDEGGSVALDGSNSSDPDQSAATLTYLWDLDDDGNFGETGAAAANGDEVGATPTFLAGALDGPFTQTIRLRVVDDGSLSDETSTTVKVNNVVPVVDPIVGPAVGVVGQTLSYSGSFSDPGPDTHTLEWEVTDSTSAVVATGSGATFDFVPAALGSYTITFNVTDDDGDGASATLALQVEVAVIAPDPVNPGQNVLFVGPIDGSDQDIDVKDGPGTGLVVRVKITTSDHNDYLQDFAQPIDRIVIFGGSGDDNIKVHTSLNIPSEIYGGDGDDKLRGGDGDDVIVGGPGDDLVVGKDGRDLLIGGLGADKLIGDQEDDILIGGVYVGQTDRVALNAIMTEWSNTAVTFADRIAHLLAGVGPGGAYALNDTTVFDDGVKDKLRGNSGMDWFLANTDDDKLDAGCNDFLTQIEIDFIEVVP